jgi:hypothetical protein
MIHTSQAQRTVLWLSVAMRDPRVWGEDAEQVYMGL